LRPKQSQKGKIRKFQSDWNLRGEIRLASRKSGNLMTGSWSYGQIGRRKTVQWVIFAERPSSKNLVTKNESRHETRRNRLKICIIHSHWNTLKELTTFCDIQKLPLNNYRSHL
jgi:hypothetical protein